MESKIYVCPECGATIDAYDTPDIFCPVCNIVSLEEAADYTTFDIFNTKLLSASGTATHMIIPDKVKSIGLGAFTECRELTSVTIPHSVTSIGAYIFQRCENLTEIIIHDGITHIGQLSFAFCEGVKSIHIPHSVLSVGEGAFYGCSNLTDITIDNILTTMYSDSFKDTSEEALAKMFAYASETSTEEERLQDLIHSIAGVSRVFETTNGLEKFLRS